jgi:hypothetical protein
MDRKYGDTEGKVESQRKRMKGREWEKGSQMAVTSLTKRGVQLARPLHVAAEKSLLVQWQKKKNKSRRRNGTG